MDRNVRQRTEDAPDAPFPLVGPLAERLNYTFGSNGPVPRMEVVEEALWYCIEMPGATPAKMKELFGVFKKVENWYKAKERARQHKADKIRAEAVSALMAEAARLTAERDAEREEKREEKRKRAVAEAFQRKPYIAEMNQADVLSFAHEVYEALKTNTDCVKEVETLLPFGVLELVLATVKAMGAQKYEANTKAVERLVKRLFAMSINGDFQRGKSTVEALIAQINFAINASTTVGDKCCTILVTVQRAWALALHSTVVSKTARNDGEAETETEGEGEGADCSIDLDELEDEERGVDAADLGPMPIARLQGRGGRESVRNCLRQGGLAVAFRTEPQYEVHAKLIDEINDSRGPEEKAFVYTLVLDEADKFFGDGKAAHARKLEHMLGFSGGGANKPVLMVAVSATNMGISNFLMRRMHKLDNKGQRCLEFMDQVSFKPPREGTYRSATAPFLDDGEVVELPRPDDDYVTPQMERLWTEVMNSPYAMLVDTSCLRVNLIVKHNMLDHVNAIVDSIPSDKQRPMAAVHVHGGHTTHQGCIGLQLVCEDNLPEEERGLFKLKEAHKRLADAEEALADALAAEGANPRLIADARKMALALRDAGASLEPDKDTECIEAHSLAELAWAMRREANRLGHFKDEQILALDDPPASFNRDEGPGKSPWATKHLPLMLFIIRKFIRADLPIGVIGNAMIKRSMSIVAVDYLRPKISVEIDGPAFAGVEGQPKCLALITHQIHTRCANAPDGAQMAARNRSTLTNFDIAHPELFVLNARGEACVRELVVEDLSDATRGIVAYNAMETWKAPMPERMRTMKRIYEATKAAERERTIQRFRMEVLDDAHKRDMFDTLVMQVGAASDVGDTITDETHMLALGCAMAEHVPLPASTCTLIQRHKNSLFQAGAGVSERDLANIHANLCCIAENHQPLAFRHALTKRRGGSRGGGGGALSGVAQLCLQHLIDRNIREDADGNAPADPPEAWDIFWALRVAHKDKIFKDGYSELRVTSNRGCGCGLALNKLFAAGLVRKGKCDRAKPDPEPGLGVSIGDGRPRSVNCFWLREDVGKTAAVVLVAEVVGVAGGN